MAGILSKGIKFSVATYSGSTLGSYTEVANLQSIPALGGGSEKVDVTTLANGIRQYIKGVKDFGDLGFKFLYDNSGATSNYRVLKGYDEGNTLVGVKVELPDTTAFTFDAYLEVSLDEVGVNDPLTFTCNAMLQSDMTIADPSI